MIIQKGTYHKRQTITGKGINNPVRVYRNQSEDDDVAITVYHPEPPQIRPKQPDNYRNVHNNEVGITNVAYTGNGLLNSLNLFKKRAQKEVPKGVVLNFK